MEDAAGRVFYNLRVVVISRIDGTVGVEQFRSGPACAAVSGAEDVKVRAGTVHILI